MQIKRPVVWFGTIDKNIVIICGIHSEQGRIQIDGDKSKYVQEGWIEILKIIEGIRVEIKENECFG